MQRRDGIAAYRSLFGQSFPEVAAGALIDVSMFGRTIADFEYSIKFADAPIDQFARGNARAMTNAEKRPIEPVLATVDPILAHPIQLTARQFSDLLVFVRVDCQKSQDR